MYAANKLFLYSSLAFTHTLPPPLFPSHTTTASSRFRTPTLTNHHPSINMASQAYDPRRSNVKEEALAEFIRAPITGELTEVPGIGPKAAEALASGDDPNEKITNTYQLLGKYLMLKGPDDGEHTVSCVEHCDKFWAFLQSKGVNSYRSGIVQCIAEKCNILLPGIYDDTAFSS